MPSPTGNRHLVAGVDLVNSRAFLVTRINREDLSNLNQLRHAISRGLIVGLLALPQLHSPIEAQQELPTCIVLDQDDQGLRLTSPADGVDFDLDGDGKRERVGWTYADRKEGFLAIDSNTNGAIDSGSELIGSGLKDRRLARRMNGFDALLFLQGAVLGPDGQPQIAGDPQLNANDAVYRELMVWFDLNHNGRSEAAELSTLEKASISEFFVGYRRAPDIAAGQRYAPYAVVTSTNGSRVRFYGRYTVESHSAELTRAAFEVSLLRR
jgi:hypothetical protein